MPIYIFEKRLIWESDKLILLREVFGLLLDRRKDYNKRIVQQRQEYYL